MTKAYSYGRFSSPEQAKGHSKQRQLEDCKAYCAKHGLDLATEDEYAFFDEGKSAYKGDHVAVDSQLSRFLLMVQDKRIKPGSYLVIESLDRLSREHVIPAQQRFLALLSAGITIVTLSDGERVYHSTSDMPEIMYSLMVMSRANEESSTKAKRVSAAWKSKLDRARDDKKPKPIRKTLPLWLEYRPGADEYQLIDDRVAVVRRIFDLAIAGHGMVVIAKTLNDDKIPAFKTGDKLSGTWGASSINRILTNKAVIGQYQPKTRKGTGGKLEDAGDAIDGFYPAIIDPATFYATRGAVDARKIARATKQSQDFNVWQGIGKCSSCGSARHLVDKGRPPRGAKYLSCANYRKGLCTSKDVRLDQSELVFREMLYAFKSLPLVQDSRTKTEADLAEVEGRLADKKQNLNRLQPLLVGGAPTASLVDAVRKLDQEIDALAQQAESLLANLAADRWIGNKEEFFANLDLVSPAGRNKANALLKRLKVQVYIGKGYYYVVQDGYSQFVMAYHDGHIAYRALAEDMSVEAPTKYDGDADKVGARLLDALVKGKPFIGKTKVLP